MTPHGQLRILTTEGACVTVDAAARRNRQWLRIRRGLELGIVGKLVAGEWELALPNMPALRNRFNAGASRTLFVVTSSRRTPDWPM
jgi:hypothetical protein